MQRIEYPKGSKVTIEDGVILIEPIEKWEPKARERYWSFRAAGVYNRINTLNDIDLFVINNGFAFQTEAEAQEFFDKIKQLANENR